MGGRFSFPSTQQLQDQVQWDCPSAAEVMREKQECIHSYQCQAEAEDRRNEGQQPRGAQRGCRGCSGETPGTLGNKEKS